mmetsp:Transcript_48077/g.79148  ORF Transcript_48077/g.79148 Transcript_48077/m.79148 type:complete len:203 (-) Transcript_48077:894-1502(-)
MWSLSWACANLLTTFLSTSCWMERTPNRRLYALMRTSSTSLSQSSWILCRLYAVDFHLSSSFRAKARSCSVVNGRKNKISLIRPMNSSRLKCCFSSGRMVFSRKSSLRGSGADGSSQSSILARALTASSAISRWAKLLVITKMASIHSTSSPFPSVSRPSSKVCRRQVRMSGWAFSTSSNNTTALGQRRNRLVSCPPSSYPA